MPFATPIPTNTRRCPYCRRPLFVDEVLCPKCARDERTNRGS